MHANNMCTSVFEKAASQPLWQRNWLKTGQKRAKMANFQKNNLTDMNERASKNGGEAACNWGIEMICWEWEEKKEKKTVAKAFDGQWYPLPLCEWMWMLRIGSGPKGPMTYA